MKNIKLSSLLLIILGGALTCFLWLPLLPVVIPLVALTIGARWIGEIMVSDAWAIRRMSSQMSPAGYSPHMNSNLGNSDTQHYLPLGEAWQHEQNFEPSDPHSLFRETLQKKSARRETREYRKLARVLNGMAVRRHLAHTQ